jgi:hypothetical protein
MLNCSWDGEQGVSIKESMRTLFAAQLTAGANTWDAKGHAMSGSNDIVTRTEAFAWIAQHEDTFYDSRESIEPHRGIFLAADAKLLCGRLYEVVQGCYERDPAVASRISNRDTPHLAAVPRTASDSPGRPLYQRPGGRGDALNAVGHHR